jgi:hypothetical protein
MRTLVDVRWTSDDEADKSPHMMIALGAKTIS